MQRVCLVVHRYGKDVVGGSEQLTRCYAQMLANAFEVHVATSCAEDYISWANKLPPGTSDDGGVHVHRFPTDFERSAFWHQLHELLLLRHVLREPLGSATPELSVEHWPLLWNDPKRKQALREAAALLPRAIQEEFIARQGPYSTGLLEFLRQERDNFDAFLFFTYLYPTTYFGARQVPRARRVIVPTLHDEPTAYLPVYGELMQDFDRIVFLSPGEQKFAAQIYRPETPGTLIGMPVNAAVPAATAKIPKRPYILYCGRIESAKGCNLLFDHFISYKREHSSDLALVLTGHAVQPVPAHPDISYLGFVTEGEKAALMRSATAFIQPSCFESFSIVLMEAFLAGTPALVNANSLVMSEHCRMAEAGFSFRTYEEFAEELSSLLENPELRRRLGDNGRTYVEQNYSSHVVEGKLRALITGATNTAGCLG